MKQLTFLLGLVLILSSCTTPSYTGCAPTVGDLVECSVTIDSGSTYPPIVAYYNATEQMEYYTFPSASVLSWSISFNTTKINQHLYMSFSTTAYTGISKNAVIKVNGVLVEEGTGSSGVIIECN